MNELRRNEYQDLGFTIVRQVFQPEAIAELREACDQLVLMAKDFHEDAFIDVTFFNLMRPCNPFAKDLASHPVIPGQLRRVTYPYGVSRIIDQLRTHDSLLNAVAELFEPNLVQIVNQINFSPPNIGTGWGWHQDYRFRHRGLPNPMQNFVQTVTAIDPCNERNGGLRLIPQSHRLGELALDQANEDAERHFDPKLAVTPDLAPGDTVFFNPLVIHGSGENRSDQLRRVFINGYARGGMSSIGMPVMKEGAIIRERSGTMEYELDRDILPLASKY